MTYDEEKKVADVIVALTERIGALESELAHEASHRQKLQNALAYWMPGVTKEIEISTNGRCGDDALLLVGSEGPFDDKCWGNEAIARAEAAEAEVKRQADNLSWYRSGSFAHAVNEHLADAGISINGDILHDCIRRTALASTGGEHHGD